VQAIALPLLAADVLLPLSVSLYSDSDSVCTCLRDSCRSIVVYELLFKKRPALPIEKMIGKLCQWEIKARHSVLSDRTLLLMHSAHPVFQILLILLFASSFVGYGHKYLKIHQLVVLIPDLIQFSLFYIGSHVFVSVAYLMNHKSTHFTGPRGGGPPGRGIERKKILK
jgi:hypothetical protein